MVNINSQTQHRPSLALMNKFHSENQQEFLKIQSFDFNIFEFAELVGRDKALPYLVYRLIEQLPGFNLEQSRINCEKLNRFLQRIAGGYMQAVQYHNDLHGADVAQMANMMIHSGNLK